MNNVNNVNKCRNHPAIASVSATATANATDSTERPFAHGHHPRATPSSRRSLIDRSIDQHLLRTLYQVLTDPSLPTEFLDKSLLAIYLIIKFPTMKLKTLQKSGLASRLVQSTVYPEKIPGRRSTHRHPPHCMYIHSTRLESTCRPNATVLIPSFFLFRDPVVGRSRFETCAHNPHNSYHLPSPVILVRNLQCS